MVAHASRHCGRNPQGLMDAPEIVIHVKERDCVAMIVQLLAKGVGQPREAPHSHPHVEILALNVARAYVFRIGATAKLRLIATETDSRAISDLRLWR